jgi:hypothetical protein
VPEFDHPERAAASAVDSAHDLGEQRSGHHDNAKGDIRGYVK